MNPFPIPRAGAFVSSVAGSVGALLNAFSSLSHNKPIRVSVSDVRTRCGNHFESAMRMSEVAFHGFVGVVRPRPPHSGVSAEVRTALALRYMGGRSYVDIYAAFCAHSATVYRALWDVVDAVNCSPGLALDFQLAD